MEPTPKSDSALHRCDACGRLTWLPGGLEALLSSSASTASPNPLDSHDCVCGFPSPAGALRRIWHLEGCDEPSVTFAEAVRPTSLDEELSDLIGWRNAMDILRQERSASYQVKGLVSCCQSAFEGLESKKAAAMSVVDHVLIANEMRKRANAAGEFAGKLFQLSSKRQLEQYNAANELVQASLKSIILVARACCEEGTKLLSTLVAIDETKLWRLRLEYLSCVALARVITSLDLNLLAESS